MQQVPKKPKRFPRGKRNNGWKYTRNKRSMECGKSLVSVAEMTHFNHGRGIALSVSRPAQPGRNVRHGKVVPSAITIRKGGRVRTTMLLGGESAVALYEALRNVMESAR